jgi:hypothetical protein
MDYIVQKHSRADFYGTFSEWLEQHSFPQINELVLPNNVFVCYSEGIPIYCIWLYFTDSKLCWVAFPASNKNVNYKKRIGGMEFLLDSVSRYCKRKKIVTIITTSNTDSVIKPLLNSGFELGDSNVNHYIKKI